MIPADRRLAKRVFVNDNNDLSVNGKELEDSIDRENSVPVPPALTKAYGLLLLKYYIMS